MERTPRMLQEEGIEKRLILIQNTLEELVQTSHSTLDITTESHDKLNEMDGRYSAIFRKMEKKLRIIKGSVRDTPMCMLILISFVCVILFLIVKITMFLV